MPLSFQNNQSSTLSKVLLAVLLAVSLACFVVYDREGPQGPLHTVQNVVMSMATPLSSVGTSVGNFFNGLTRSVEDATADEETLSALRQQNEELRNMLAQAEEYRKKAQDYEELLNMKDIYSVTGVTGSVIGRSMDAWNQTLTLNVGSNDGIKTGLTVIGATGVVGQTISVTPTSCVVRLLTDPQSGAAAIVQQNRAEGIVRGSLTGLLYLENIDADVSIEVGDLVLTSGLGGSYQRGLFIGTVVTVDGRVGDASRSIVVAPNESAFLLEEVIVVLDARASDQVLNSLSLGDKPSGPLGAIPSEGDDTQNGNEPSNTNGETSGETGQDGNAGGYSDTQNAPASGEEG